MKNKNKSGSALDILVYTAINEGPLDENNNGLVEGLKTQVSSKENI